VVVYFYPSAFTGGCNLEAHTFAENKEKFDAAPLVDSTGQLQGIRRCLELRLPRVPALRQLSPAIRAIIAGACFNQDSSEVDRYGSKTRRSTSGITSALCRFHLVRVMPSCWGPPSS